MIEGGNQDFVPIIRSHSFLARVFPIDYEEAMYITNNPLDTLIVTKETFNDFYRTFDILGVKKRTYETCFPVVVMHIKGNRSRRLEMYLANSGAAKIDYFNSISRKTELRDIYGINKVYITEETMESKDIDFFDIISVFLNTKKIFHDSRIKSTKSFITTRDKYRIL